MKIDPAALSIPTLEPPFEGEAPEPEGSAATDRQHVVRALSALVAAFGKIKLIEVWERRGWQENAGLRIRPVGLRVDVDALRRWGR